MHACMHTFIHAYVHTYIYILHLYKCYILHGVWFYVVCLGGAIEILYLLVLGPFSTVGPAICPFSYGLASTARWPCDGLT